MDFPIESSQQFNEAQKQAISQVKEILTNHFDASVCIIMAENSNDARLEHIEYVQTGSPLRGFALASLAPHFSHRKFLFNQSQ